MQTAMQCQIVHHLRVFPQLSAKDGLLKDLALNTACADAKCDTRAVRSAFSTAAVLSTCRHAPKRGMLTRYGRGLTSEELEEATAQGPTLSGEDTCLRSGCYPPMTSRVLQFICCLECGGLQATKPRIPVPDKLQPALSRSTMVGGRPVSNTVTFHDHAPAI